MGEKFFEEWRVYEKILVNDYMDHQALFARLQEEILRRFSQPISLLDLGCGDLTPVLPLLDKIPLERYVGVDESVAALDIAARRLDEFPVSKQLITGDLSQVLPAIEEKFDVILASFSLHHLTDPVDKQHILEAAQRHLNPGGLFALIDVFSAESETREQYLARWMKHASERFEALIPEEKALLFEHVKARDFPLSESAYKALAAQDGLVDFEMLQRDQTGFYGLAAFSREP